MCLWRLPRTTKPRVSDAEAPLVLDPIGYTGFRGAYSAWVCCDFVMV
jgi:hypothetical protein